MLKIPRSVGLEQGSSGRVTCLTSARLSTEKKPKTKTRNSEHSKKIVCDVREFNSGGEGEKRYPQIKKGKRKWP
jgi:hypothetical protein